MPTTDSNLTSMEDPHALEAEEGSSTNVPSSVPPTTVPSSPPEPTTTRPNIPSETEIENKAVSMASNDCSSALSSPAEASPAKPVAASPVAFEGSVETSPATSHITSASDSLTCMGTSLVNIPESLPSLSGLPSKTFGGPNPENAFPAVLTFKGVSVTLENNSVWKQFNSCGTEMILTKQGRRMFPYCRYRLAGLDPERQYSLVLSIVPSDQYRYRWSTTKWEVSGRAEHQAQGLIRAFSHHYSPCQGSDWMGSLVSFYKLKLTNNVQDQDGHITLNSMHRYIPRLHVIPVPDGVAPTPDQPVVVGPECMTFTFPQTEFMAVTTYQNFRITQLKINHNPFAKGFREDGNNPRLKRVTTDGQVLVKTDAQPSILKLAELSENKTEEVHNLSVKNDTVPASPSNEQETRLVLKPIMSSSSNNSDPYVPCIRGKHALGELVLVQKRPLVEPKEEADAVSKTPKLEQGIETTPEATSMTPTSSTSTPASSPGYHKRRKRINRRWGHSRGREWKAAAASPTVAHSPSSTVAMQPELDDVEGLLFVSFTSKEALEVHAREQPVSSTPSASPVSLTTPVQLKEKVEVIPETDEEKIACLEAVLLQDLRALKHRQVIHPVLQEVGLKLSSLDLTQSIDLQYLGVRLPLPPPNIPEQGNTTAQSPGDEGLSFISRTGKTSDMTKIKGWRNKFIRSKEPSLPNCNGTQKNLSAFCSNMLDEYLESEAQNISERAAAFSTHSEDSVAYQLPAKSSSYVKTLDSALKHREAASRLPVEANKPCPLSYKPLLYSALMSPTPPLARPVQDRAPSTQQSASSDVQPGAQRLYTNDPAASQRPAVSCGQNQVMTHRPMGFTKFQFKLYQMEIGALNEGLSKTQLTEDRLKVALSLMLTKQMLPNQALKLAQYPRHKSTVPKCGQEFCTLGCVCSSLQHPNRGPLHCRRPECMFGCACFKRKITKQLSAGESEEEIQPVYSVTNMEHVVQPGPGSHANKLWNHDIDNEDPEPLFAPEHAPLCLPMSKSLKRGCIPHPTQPIREEDKDPVYKYLESLMTCARIREFTSKPPDEVTIEPKVLDAPATTTTTTTTTTTDSQPKMYYRSLLTGKKAAERAAQTTTSSEKEAKKQIEIQSACQWKVDRKKILETLCRRLKHNRLCRRFYIGPYRIRPIAKIFMQKPSGSIVTFRIQISKPAKASDVDEDDFDDSDEEQHAGKNRDGDIDAEEDDCENEESDMQFGVTPFLSGVLPAGRLTARTKPAGCQAYGLIQVNGKSYNQARLMLGSMGSLHPANRLAAFVTGRLLPPSGISLKNSQTSDATNQIPTVSALRVKAAGTVVPPVITAQKVTDLKTPAQPPAQLLPPDFKRKSSITLAQLLQKSINRFAPDQRSSVNPLQNISTPSPVSLTVSPSLKSPSFLEQSGTYSFRICPPANQGTRGQNLPGVILPGGFTLIQLPKPGADGAASESGNATDMAAVDKATPQKDAFLNFGHLAAHPDAKRPGLDNLTGAKKLSVEPGPSSELTCDEKMPSDDSHYTTSKKVESNLDNASEDLNLSSDFSDYCGEGDEDDEEVDIETVEEWRQGQAIAQMREAVRMTLKDSRDSSDGFGSARELDGQDQMDDELDEHKDNKRRKNHTVLERQRRTEQRVLFDKLQTILRSDPRTPRLRLLSQAVREIQNLVETSRHLEERKKRLTQMQSLYVMQLSRLSGKSELVIRHKLNEICDRQKMREKTMKWQPFFSNLLQSRAAFLQATMPQSKLQSTQLSQSDFNLASSQANAVTQAVQKKIMSLLQTNLQRTPAPSSVRTPMPPPFSSPAQVEVTAPPLQGGQPPTNVSPVEGQQAIPAAPAQSSVAAPVRPPQPFALPLIRSKTGRIILPSSLKPIGNGLYTLTVMEPKQKGGEGKVIASPVTQPSEVDKLKNSSDQPLDSESCRSSKEDETVQSSNSKPKRSGSSPLVKLALLNKSIFVPSVSPQAAESSNEGGAPVGVNKTPAALCLSFKEVKQVPTPAEPEPSPPVVRRPRGRPRKHPVNPVDENETNNVGEDASKSVSESETSVVVEEKQEITSELPKTSKEGSPAMVSDTPAPVKRGRGRPPKKKSELLWSPPGVRAGSPSKSSEDSPVRFSISFKSPDTGPRQGPLGDINTSRPLTRGALGKDFPSAKKRSWIDVEKELELEPDVESE
ncbi:hypothetical protein ABVT39_028064 [Epinephelus coioides]